MWRMEWEQVNSTEGNVCQPNGMEETDNGKVVNPHRRKVVQWVTEWPIWSRNLTASNIWPVHLYKNVICKQNNSVLLLCFVPTRRSQATVTVKRCTHTQTYTQTDKQAQWWGWPISTALSHPLINLLVASCTVRFLAIDRQKPSSRSRPRASTTAQQSHSSAWNGNQSAKQCTSNRWIRQN